MSDKTMFAFNNALAVKHGYRNIENMLKGLMEQKEKQYGAGSRKNL